MTNILTIYSSKMETFYCCHDRLYYEELVVLLLVHNVQ